MRINENKSLSSSSLDQIVFISFILDVVLVEKKQTRKFGFSIPHLLTSFSVYLLVKLYSSDVREFLHMDKIQNLSDASEDEDEKVRCFCA